jgi:hypothetical protein
MNDPVTWLFNKLWRMGFYIGGLIGVGLREILVAAWRAVKRLFRRRPTIGSGERAVILSEDAERERVAGCKTVVFEFAEGLGYIARLVMDRTELGAKIDSGITPEALASELHDRIEKIPGITLGKRHFPNFTYDMKLPYSLRNRHIYMVGRSGGGKTNLIRSMILQDIFYGCGVGVLAPEGELLTDEILPYIPQNRIDDVVYVNPADTVHPIAFNPLHLEPDENIEQKFQDTLSIFKRLFGEKTGARMDAIIRHMLYAMLEYPNTTLLDIERLLDPTDPTLRDEVVRTTKDEQTRRFFGKTYSEFPKDAALPITNRLSPLIRPQVIRNLLCQTGQSFNFREAMDGCGSFGTMAQRRAMTSFRSAIAGHLW